LQAKVLIAVQKKRLRDAIEAIYQDEMQLARESSLTRTAASAYDVADYVAAMASELSVMARAAGLHDLAGALEQAQRFARQTLAAHQGGNAAPDDAA